jgi:Enoyl-(Acyl carrier protein) reductase
MGIVRLAYLNAVTASRRVVAAKRRPNFSALAGLSVMGWPIHVLRRCENLKPPPADCSSNSGRKAQRGSRASCVQATLSSRLGRIRTSAEPRCRDGHVVAGSSQSTGCVTLFPIWMENTPMKRVARADEIASAILFLASEASSAMTGSLLVVDCGYTIW